MQEPQDSHYTGDIESWLKISFYYYNYNRYSNPLCNGASLYFNGKLVTDVVVPDTITKINDCAFDGCTSLTSITIPDSVTSISNDAFRGCTSLTSITIPDSVTSIGERAFYIYNYYNSLYNYYNNLEKVYYGGTADQWSSISIGSDNSKLTGATRYYYSETEPSDKGYYWRYVDGALTVWPMLEFSYTANDDGKTCTITGIVINTDKNLVIPDSLDGYEVTGIGSSAFTSNKTFTSITIPDSVTSIGEDAFRYCTNLASIIIGDSVTNIGRYAFEDCKSLTSITIPDSVTSIGDCAFYGCTSLTSITIGDSVTSIGSWAFDGCTSLTSITIPDSVTSIGDRAFNGCTSLKKVYYGGTADQWSSISIDSYNSKLTGATRYYYSETEPTDDGNYWHYVGGKVTEW